MKEIQTMKMKSVFKTITFFLLAVVVACGMTAVSFADEAATDAAAVTARVADASAQTVTVKWTKAGEGTVYRLLRATKKSGTYKTIYSGSRLQHKNRKLSTKKTYYYKVTASMTDGRSAVSNIVRKVKVKGDYSKGTVYGPYMSKKQRLKVRDRVAWFVNTKITGGMSSYDKVKKAHDWMCRKDVYANSGEDSVIHSAYGSLISGKAQCSGYSRGFKALCAGMGIKCYYVHASSKAVNPYHQWDIVKVSGHYYHIDVQCNDSSGFYAVFLISDKMMKNYGMRWDTGKYPKCPKPYIVN